MEKVNKKVKAVLDFINDKVDKFKIDGDTEVLGKYKNVISFKNKSTEPAATFGAVFEQADLFKDFKIRRV